MREELQFLTVGFVSSDVPSRKSFFYDSILQRDCKIHFISPNAKFQHLCGKRWSFLEPDVKLTTTYFKGKDHVSIGHKIGYIFSVSMP